MPKILSEKQKFVNATDLKGLLSYDEQTGEFYWLVKRGRGIKPGDIAGSIAPIGYRLISVNGRFYYAHRLAWLYVFGEWPDGQIDHINGVRSDNRITNLRSVSNRENHKNTKLRSDNTSGVNGVYWSNVRSKWIAQIVDDEKVKFLGAFANLEDAAKARKKAELANGFHPNHGRLASIA